MARRQGFSWKRATGVTNLKRKIGKATGIPFTATARKNKLKRMVGINTSRRRKPNAGCATLLILCSILSLVLMALRKVWWKSHQCILIYKSDYMVDNNPNRWYDVNVNKIGFGG